MATWELKAELMLQFLAALDWGQVDLHDQGNVKYQVVQANKAESSRRSGDNTVQTGLWVDYERGLRSTTRTKQVLKPDLNPRFVVPN
jgi:hypothetical protein